MNVIQFMNKKKYGSSLLAATMANCNKAEIS